MSARVVTGDDTGLFKVVNVGKKTVEIRYGSQAMARGVERMTWAGEAVGAGGPQTHFYAALRSGEVECRALADGELLETMGFKIKSSGCAGLGYLGEGRMAACGRKGLVQIFSPEEKEYSESDTIQVGQDIRAMEISTESQGKILATGGNEELLKLWDIKTKKTVFKARNVKPDMLDLRYPVHVAVIRFVPGHGYKRVLSGTAHHQVRLYDIKSGRRPVWSVNHCENAIRALVALSDGNSLIFGDGAGESFHVDIRTSRVIGKFKGVGGAITSLREDPSREGLVASTSLDRFVRVYDIKSRRMVNKVYAKQRLSDCLFLANPEAQEDKEEDEEVWEQLEKKEKSGKSEKREKREKNSKQSRKRKHVDSGEP
ncbi:hypothetical protein AAMO2058_000134100 [Amorphochlora amoebiformis]